MRPTPYSLVVFAALLCFTASAVETAYLDKQASPCTDFYQYACGSWIKATPLPPDRPDWNLGFSALDAKNEELLFKVLEGYRNGKNSPPNPYAAQMGQVYAACLDEKNIAVRAPKEFRRLIEPIERLKTGEGLGSLLATLHLQGVDALFAYNFDQDALDPSVNLMVADQGGLGLPTRDYYFSQDPASVTVRNAYRAMIEAALLYAGRPPAEAAALATKALALETKLAEASLEPVDRRNPLAVYHRFEKKGLQALAPHFGWKDYWRELGLESNDKINVAVPAFFTSLNKVIVAAPTEEVRAYLIARTFASVGDALDSPAAQSHFNYVAALRGLKKQPPRKRRCLKEVSAGLGMALGKAYVDLTFGEQSKQLALAMVEKLKVQMKARLEAAQWMDAATRKTALEKLTQQKIYMGYPDRWRSYRGLKVSGKSMLTNRLNLRAFNLRYEFKKLPLPHDRSEWNVSPSVVNAINTVSQNKLNFPAAILQPPNFGKSLSLVENYGAMGTIVGHEITHGYDDMGRQFDERGAVRDWWSKETTADFEKRSACIVKQYDGYKLDSGQKLNGRLTQGEAAADLGGMKLAYSAWKAQTTGPTDTPDATGFSGDQHFFLSLAQAWCEKMAPEFENMVVRSDPHPPSRFRINGTVRNVPEFAKAFQCKAGEPMAPEVPCEIW